MRKLFAPVAVIIALIVSIFYTMVYVAACITRFVINRKVYKWSDVVFGHNLFIDKDLNIHEVIKSDNNIIETFKRVYNNNMV